MIERPRLGQVVGLHFRDKIVAHQALEGRLAIVDLIQPDGKPPICVLPVAGGARTWVYRSNLVRVPVRRHRRNVVLADGRRRPPQTAGSGHSTNEASPLQGDGPDPAGRRIAR